jgi:hypothetical protein
MKTRWILAAAAVVGVSATGLSAQAQDVVNLSGQFQCLQNCQGPGPAFVTQNGWDMNLTNEAGQPSRAWIDYPGHIWARDWNMGATYSPDGMAIQFDNGAVWHRPELVPPPPPFVGSRG